ncbi:MAG: hypothetical protein M3O61_12945 [Gemmatimonadota bacterium]|nr:hypothetical protein [Gemmatimonadota bacterium]
MKRKIAHIVNPVVVAPESDLFLAQPIVFETMRAAREAASSAVEVELFSAQYQEDRVLVPEFFLPTPDLNRSILDVGSFRKPYKFPLIRDILDRLYEATDAEYLIYTNVDIGLMPFFYSFVNDRIEQGYDAFVINRRTLPDRDWRTEDIPQMYALIGEAHRGHDCFVFRRDSYPPFKLGNACIGVPRVGMVLLCNLICQAKRFEKFKDHHLTFHVGARRQWSNADEFKDYRVHNQNEYHRVLKDYESEGRVDAHLLFGSLLQEVEESGRRNREEPRSRWRGLWKLSKDFITRQRAR